MNPEVVEAFFNYRNKQKVEAANAISNYKEKVKSAITARIDIIELKHELQKKRY